MYESVATLIHEEITVDDIGNETRTETPREVYCFTRGITRAEFYQAASAGLKPTVVLLLSVPDDYEGETLVEWEGTRYSVLRTYQPEGSDHLELTLEEKVDDYE